MAALKLCTGVDLIEIERVQAALTRHGKRFLDRVFTAREVEQAGGRAGSLAACFAAKEAASKALGTGIGAVGWQEIEVLHAPSGAPELYLHGEAARLAEAAGARTWSVSLSHTKEYAIAMVVGVGCGGR